MGCGDGVIVGASRGQPYDPGQCTPFVRQNVRSRTCYEPFLHSVFRPLDGAWAIVNGHLQAGPQTREVSNAGAVAFAGCCLKRGAVDNGDPAMTVADDPIFLQL